MANLTHRGPATRAGIEVCVRAAAASLLAVVLAGAWGGCRAQSPMEAAEYEVKAAFLYKFASYVEWPPAVFEGPRNPFVIGVAGADVLASALDRVAAGRSIGGRPVEVRKLHRGDLASGLQILFVGRSDGGKPSDFLASTRGRPVLTVSDSEDVFALGSMINFVIVDDKVRFDVALHEAEVANLKVSARLLSVARRVRGGPS